MRKTMLLCVAFFIATLSIHSETLIGKVNGNLDVSSTGAAIYNIPIDVLSAPYDFTPRLTLTYNSQSGNGLAGFGWNLSGLSSITIGPRDVYFDGTAEGMYEGEDNAYYLDGMRLLLVSGENGQAGAEYRTESEQYAIIRIDSVLAETPAMFTVQTKDGTTYKYGSSSGRCHYSNSACYEWALDYAEDRLGNYISYEYIQEGLALVPVSIKYGRNRYSSGSVTHSIDFTYGSRSDAITVHRFQRTEPFRLRLVQVSCMRKNVPYRHYILSYEQGTPVFSHLTSVRQEGLQSASYPETTFVWENLPGYNLESSSPSVSNIPGHAFSDMYFLAADDENNGCSNLIGLYTNNVNDLNPYLATEIWTRNNSGALTSSNLYLTQAGVNLGEVYKADREGGVVAHISNSRANSIVLPYRTSSDGTPRIVFDCVKEGLLFPYLMQGSSDEVRYIITDIDKDGHDDVVLVEKGKKNGTYPACLINFNLSTDSISYNTFSMNLEGAPTRITSADINADGMADLLVCTTNGYYIYWNHAGGFSDIDRFHATDFAECDVLEMGDVNGDGLVDLILNKKNSTNWLCAINQGTTTAPFNFYAISLLENAGATNRDDNEAYCIVQDFNNDGKSDLLIGMALYNDSDYFGGQFIFLKSEGAVFSLLDSCGFPTEETFPTLGKIVQGDFDGNGVPEILYYGGAFHSSSSDVAWRMLKPVGYSPATNHITSVTDGLGTTQKIEYALLTDETAYQRTEESTFPLLTMRAALPVVKRTETIAGNDTLWTNLQYKNAIYHWQGKGLLGFKSRTITSSTGQTSAQQYAVNDNYYVLHMTSERVYASDHSLWKTDSLVTTFNAVGPKRYFMFCSHERMDDHPSHLVDKSYQEYDSYGCLIYSGKNDEMFFSDTDYTLWESTEPGRYIKGLPSMTETTLSGGTLGEEETERVVYTRDNTTGLPLTCMTYRNGTLLQTDLYTYNPCGQVLSHTTVNGTSTDSLTTTYRYSPNGLLLHVTDPMGLTTHYIYDTRGQLYSERDHLNVYTFHHYDEMLREDQVYSSIMRKETSIGAGDYANSVFKVTETQKGEPTLITYYDGLERKVAEAQQRFDGRWLYTDYQYLPSGQLGFVSFPHTSTSVSSTGTFNTYDVYGRMTSQTDTNGKTSSWSHAPYEVSSTINGITQTTSYVNRNVVASVEDNSGYVDYETDAAARVRNIYHNNKETIIDYDDFGRIVQTTDMMGIARSYEFDANGHLAAVSQGTSTRITVHDKFGRLLSQTFQDANMPDVLTTYSYNDKNQLVCDSSHNHVYRYEYDTYGRLRKEYRSIADTESIDITYTYDSNGQLSQKKAVLGTAGVTLTEKYNYAHGWRTAISVNDSLVWQLDGEDEKGMTSQTSNLLDTLTWGYDNYGHLLSQHVGTRISQTYNYDLATGNVTTWNGAACTYDEFNRLTQWKNFSSTYDDEGNILRKIPVGDMRYNGFQLEAALVNSQLGVSQYICDMDYRRSIERPNSIAENNRRAEFAYDGSRQRVWMRILKTDNHTPDTLSTRYYVSDSYEIAQKTGSFKRHYYYVGGTPYDAPAVVLIEDSVPVIYQIYRDNIGSIVMYASRGATERYWYNPWGIRLLAANYNIPAPPTYYNDNTRFFRTYTGHEEIPFFGLLNANARLYNPYLGRFMSPDPLLATEGGPLDFNPYVYARNNPLSYVDQDGELAWFVPIIIGAVAGGAFNVLHNLDDIHSFVQGLVYFGTGAAAGAASAAAALIPIGIGGFIGGAITEGIGGAISGFITGMGNAAMKGGNIWKAGLKQAWQDALSGFIMGGLTKGLEAKHNEKNFWTGANKAGLSDVNPLSSGIIPEDERMRSQIIDPTLENIDINSKPYQNHHLAPWNNQTHSAQYKEIADVYELNLKDKEHMWNVVNIPHQGSHPKEYKDWVLEQMKKAHQVANGNKVIFLNEFKNRVEIPVRMNPNMLDKSWWLQNTIKIGPKR